MSHCRKHKIPHQFVRSKIDIALDADMIDNARPAEVTLSNIREQLGQKVAAHIAPTLVLVIIALFGFCCLNLTCFSLLFCCLVLLSLRMLPVWSESSFGCCSESRIVLFKPCSRCHRGIACNVCGPQGVGSPHLVTTRTHWWKQNIGTIHQLVEWINSFRPTQSKL